MKKIGTGALFCALILSSLPALSAAENQPAVRSVSVSGDAEVRVVPDIVVVTLGIETRNKNLAALKLVNDSRIKDIIARATASGIVQNDIRTDFLQLEPEYDNNPTPKVFLGYVQRTTLVVTLRDVAKFEILMVAALQAGVERIHGVDFQTSELRKYRDQARLLAVRAAKEKATALAHELDQKVGKPQTIREGYVGWFSSYGSWWGRGSYQGQNRSQNADRSNVGDSGSQSDGLAPGTLAVRANVDIVFELE